MAAKVAVVTGSSRGIGYAVVRALLSRHPSWVVYVTSRDHERGSNAVQQLCRDTDVLPAFHELDVSSPDSVRLFSGHLRQAHRKIDVLINNASVFPKQNLTKRSRDGRVVHFDLKLVRSIINSNYFGTLNVCRELLPLLSDDARVVNLSSSFAQQAFNQFTPYVQDTIRLCHSVEDVTALINSFLALAPTYYEESGWMSSMFDDNGLFNGDIVPYGLSKIGVNLITQILQRQLDADFKDVKTKNVLVNACSPGRLLLTASTKNGGRGDDDDDFNHLSSQAVEQCAEILVYLATLPRDSPLRGQFLHEFRVEDPLTGVALSNQ